jgi:hypothetical protein
LESPNISIREIYIIIIRCYDKKKKKIIAGLLEFPIATYYHHTMFSPSTVGCDESTITDENIKDCIRTLEYICPALALYCSDELNDKVNSRNI